LSTKTENERLLTIREAMACFGMRATMFYKYRPRLLAYGLQEVRFGNKGRRFRAASIDKCIRNMAEREAHVTA